MGFRCSRSFRLTGHQVDVAWRKDAEQETAVYSRRHHRGLSHQLPLSQSPHRVHSDQEEWEASLRGSWQQPKAAVGSGVCDRSQAWHPFSGAAGTNGRWCSCSRVATCSTPRDVRGHASAQPPRQGSYLSPKDLLFQLTPLEFWEISLRSEEKMYSSQLLPPSMYMNSLWRFNMVKCLSCFTSLWFLKNCICF